MNNPASIFIPADGIVCQCCGSTNAAKPAFKFPIEICSTCALAFESWRRRWKDDAPFTANMFNVWLGRQLFLSVRRLEIYGVTGRCEAISRGNTWRRNKDYISSEGYQCGTFATTMRDGHRVCQIHADAISIAYVHDTCVTHYDTLAEMMAHLGKSDPMFRECLQRALDNSAQ